MAWTCWKHPKCCTRKDGKKCLAPDPWTIFLRTNTKKYQAIRAASEARQKSLKIHCCCQLIREASKNRTLEQTKAVFHKQ